MCKNHVSDAELKTKACLVRLVKSQLEFFQKQHLTMLINLDENLLRAWRF
jgi:hypothetical protein